jgi:hypothetical protein
LLHKNMVGIMTRKLHVFTLSLLFSLMPLNASELEIVVIQEDFSVNNWQRLSLSDSDTVFGFDITDFRYRSAPFAMTILPDYPGNQDEWIISPELDLSGSDQTPVLQFYEDSDFWFSSNATHELYYTTVANPTADDFILVTSWTSANHNIPGFLGLPVTLNLPAAMAGAPIAHIAFRYISEAESFDDYWYIDDLKITQIINYDANVEALTLNDFQYITPSTARDFSVYVRNSGELDIASTVTATLFDAENNQQWQQSLETGVIVPDDFDTLAFQIEGEFLEPDQRYILQTLCQSPDDLNPKNDTTRTIIETFSQQTPGMLDVFISSSDFFSEGMATAADSATRLNPNYRLLMHFVGSEDTLGNPGSEGFFAQSGTPLIPTAYINRRSKIYAPFTILQDWPQLLNTFNQNSQLKGEQRTFATATISVQNYDTLTLTSNLLLALEQTGHVAETNLNVQLWLKEKERDFSWLRIDKITHRALALLLDETIQSLPQPGELWSQSYSHTFSLTDNILSVHPDSAAFLLVVTDTDNQRLVYVDEINATDTVTGLDDDVAAIASTFFVAPAYPNPFNPATAVPLQLPAAGKVDFALYNAIGQRLATASKRLQAGTYRWQVNLNDRASGVYFAMFQYRGQWQTSKLILIK